MKNESIKQCEFAVSIKKDKLIKKAKSRGEIWENFGQKEVRELEDEFAMDVPEISKMILGFSEWAESFSLRD